MNERMATPTDSHQKPTLLSSLSNFCSESGSSTLASPVLLCDVALHVVMLCYQSSCWLFVVLYKICLKENFSVSVSRHHCRSEGPVCEDGPGRRVSVQIRLQVERNEPEIQIVSEIVSQLLLFQRSSNLVQQLYDS